MMISSHLQRSIVILISFLSIYPYTECVQGIPTTTVNPETIGGDFEGDILIPRLGRGVAARGDYVRWPNGTVPYYISPAYATTERATIINAMRTLENLTAVDNKLCVQFRDKVPEDDHYFINIVNTLGCSSYIGRNTGLIFNRTVSLQHPGCIYTGTIMHELLHALGFFHEQSRPDRDTYVNVIWANITSGYEHNFNKYNDSQVDTQNTPYDYSSIMHYGRNYFGINNTDTLIPILNVSATLGQRNNLSEIDIQEVRLLYNCTGSLPTTTSTTTSAITNTTTTETSTTTSSESTTTSTTTSTATTETSTTTSATTSTTTIETSTTTSSESTTTSTSTSTATTETSTTTSATTSSTQSSSTSSTNSSQTTANVSSSLSSTTVAGTTTTISVSVVSVSYSLRTSSPKFRRPNTTSTNYHYARQEFTISVSGTYNFSSTTTFSAYWYIYLNSFDPSNPDSNLFAHGKNTGDGREQIQFSVYLQAEPSNRRTRIIKRAAQKYISILTSEKEGDTGSFSTSITGPSKASASNFDLTDTNPTSSDTNENGGNKVGVIVGSVIGGVVGLLCLSCLCCGMIGTLVFFCCFRRRPLRSNPRYVRRGAAVNHTLGTALFQTGTFSGSLLIDGQWQKREPMVLSFYPGAGHVIYGKGSDIDGAYTIRGVYSIQTGRIGFDKTYDERRRETIQVEWDRNQEIFHGHSYSNTNGRYEKHKYMLRKMARR